jgi:hypothetical protein
MKFVVVSRFRLDGGDGAAQLSILRVVRIRDDLDGRHHVDRNIDGGIPRRGVGDVGAVDQSSALRRTGALEVDPPIGTSNDARNQGQRALESLVGVWCVTQRFLMDSAR